MSEAGGAAELAELRRRLQEAEDTLEAIRSGAVDAVVLDAGQGQRVYTLESADYPFRVVLNTMHEGVVTLAGDQTVVYCNQRFSDLTGVPCGSIVGRRFGEFIWGRPIELIRGLLEGARQEAQVAELDLLTAEGTPLPARLSVTAFTVAATPMLSVLVIDLTEQKRAERELLEHQGRLRQAATDLSFAEQRERQRLANLIHDSVAQTLIAVKLYTEALRANPDAAAIGPPLDQIRDMVNEAVLESRAIMTELSPPVLRGQGLVAALQWWAEHIQEKHGLSVAVDSGGTAQRFDQDAEAAVFQMAKELLQNTIKYAQATGVSIHISCSETGLDLEIADDGVGFDPASIERTERGGFGLSSVRERVGYLGGEFVIDSAPGKGTCSRITLPLSCQPVTPQA